MSINGQPFAKAISTLTEEQIKLAADKKKINVEDSSVAGQFLSKVNTSCKAIGYSSAAAKANRRLMVGLCDRKGMPRLFVAASPDDERSFVVQL